eukprot:scaffold9816_cov99-Skeletonema_dohrnii-CCMP3373.AAC.3
MCLSQQTMLSQGKTTNKDNNNRGCGSGSFLHSLRHRSVRSIEEFRKADAENGGALSAEIRGMTQDCLRILYKIRTVRRFQVA